MLLNLLIIYLIGLYITLIFSFNRTFYSLFLSSTLFLFISFFLVYLDMEFLGLSFAMIYTGGIAVMFLFLILLIEVKFENPKSLLNNFKYDFSFLLSFLFSSFFSYYFIENFSFYELNKILLLDYDTLFMFEINHDYIYTKYDLSKGDNFYNDEFILEYFFLNNNFSDTYILGVSLFKYHSILIILIGIFLLVSTLISLYLSSTIFELTKK